MLRLLLLRGPQWDVASCAPHLHNRQRHVVDVRGAATSIV